MCRFADLVHGIGIGLKTVGCAKLLGKRQLLRRQIDRNDAFGAGGNSAQQRRKPDPTETNQRRLLILCRLVECRDPRGRYREDELELALFERTSSGMVLTSAGERLLADAEKVLAAAQVLRNEAKALKGEVAGKVRVGTTSDPGFIRVGVGP